MNNAWSRKVFYRQGSPHAAWDILDLALIRQEGAGLLVLLVDGSPGSSTSRPPYAREALARAVGAAWRAESLPKRLLEAIHEELSAFNGAGTARLQASAVAATVLPSFAVAEAATAGNCSLWGCGPSGYQPLIREAVPQNGTRTYGMLGSQRPNVLSCDAGAAEFRELAFLTDGAFHVLTDNRGGLLKISSFKPERVLDDATVVALSRDSG